MNKKFHFIKSNTYLLDLGSTPGGWTQVVAKIITKGKILAVDVKQNGEAEKMPLFCLEI